MPTTFPQVLDTANTGLLLATVSSLATPYYLSSVIHTATCLTKNKLVVILFSPFFNINRGGSTYSESLGISHTSTSSWKDVQRLLTFVYVQAIKTAQEHGKVLMDVDVLLKGLNEPDSESDIDTLITELQVDAVFRVSGDSIATPLPTSIGPLRTTYLPTGDRRPEFYVAEGSYKHLSSPPSVPPTPALSRSTTATSRADVILPSLSGLAKAKPPFYPVVALGGTFDHLHAGHKILLSMGAWIATEKLIVGVTSSELLTRKPNAHLLEPLEVRMENVRAFLRRFKKSVEPYIVELKDVYGPTGYDPNIQALVVSRETVPGAAEIAAHRKAHNLPPLDLYVIDVISATSHNLDHDDVAWLKDAKLSSTFIRAWIAEQQAKSAPAPDGVSNSAN